jgi:hypothetical protein
LLFSSALFFLLLDLMIFFAQLKMAKSKCHFTLSSCVIDVSASFDFLRKQRRLPNKLLHLFVSIEYWSFSQVESYFLFLFQCTSLLKKKRSNVTPFYLPSSIWVFFIFFYKCWNFGGSFVSTVPFIFLRFEMCYSCCWFYHFVDRILFADGIALYIFFLFL